MTPIEKNIIVVDEQGREYEATYPKRAKGLVKNGRARFVAENKICLACPPDILNETEDIKMSENIQKIEHTQEAKSKQASVNSVEYILSKLAELQVQLSHELNTPSELANSISLIFESVSKTGEDVNCIELASVMTQAFSEREETYRRLISLYEKMYDDIVKEQNSLISEAQGLVEFLLDLEERGEVSELISGSVVDPLVSAFQMNALNAQKSN